MNSLFDAVRGSYKLPMSIFRWEIEHVVTRTVIPKLRILSIPNTSIANVNGNIAFPRRCESQLTFSKARLDKLKRFHGFYVDSGSHTDKSEEIAQLDEIMADIIMVKTAEGTYCPRDDEWVH